MGNDCGWEHLRAPAARKLWREGAAGAVPELLENTPVGQRWPVGAVRAPRAEEGEGEASEGEEGGPGPP